NGVDSLMGQLDLRVSGGHRQLIGLARALYHPSDLLLLDEVTNALDHHALDFVMSQILKVKKDRLVLLVSHNADALMKMADHVLEIK
ncbi:MAG TPA: AAA family ATPase, partial [Flavihumibacter sp.]